jgi:hypothetical protein
MAFMRLSFGVSRVIAAMIEPRHPRASSTPRQRLATALGVKVPDVSGGPKGRTLRKAAVHVQETSPLFDLFLLSGWALAYLIISGWF